MELLVKDLSFYGGINEAWIKENCYIAGGACVSNFTRKPINDVDLYFKTKEARDKFIKEIGEDKYISKESYEWKAMLQYVWKLKNNLIEIGEKDDFGDILVQSDTIKKFGEKYTVILLTIEEETYTIPLQLFEKQKWMFENGYDYVLLEYTHYEVKNSDWFLGNKSITIKSPAINGKETTYQFILRFYGEPQEMMDKTFDFQHCKIAYDLETNKYIATEETWQCLAKREIKYINSFYPISSLKRLYKYASRGFTYKNDEFVKIIKDIHSVDVNNRFVLEDQLVGYYEDFDYDVVFNDNPLIDKGFEEGFFLEME